MFNLSKYKINIPFFNKKEPNDNNIYILEESREDDKDNLYKYNQSNHTNNDIIIDMPMLEDLESPIYENNPNNIDVSLRYVIQQNQNTLFNTHQDNGYQRQSIYRFVKPRRYYKKYNYTEYPFYKHKK